MNIEKHWSKGPKREEVLRKIAEKKRGVPNPHKGNPNKFKGLSLPWADKAQIARQESGMYDKMVGNKYGFKKGHIPVNKGIPLSDSTKAKMTAKLKGRKVWNEGKGLGTPLNHLIRRNDKYVEWRTSVFKRDSYECVICKTAGEIHADHIKAFALICKENNISDLESALACKELWDINNGRTLCVNCHRNTPNYSGKYQTTLHKYPRIIN